MAGRGGGRDGDDARAPRRARGREGQATTPTRSTRRSRPSPAAASPAPEQRISAARRRHRSGSPAQPCGVRRRRPVAARAACRGGAADVRLIGVGRAPARPRRRGRRAAPADAVRLAERLAAGRARRSCRTRTVARVPVRAVRGRSSTCWRSRCRRRRAGGRGRPGSRVDGPKTLRSAPARCGRGGSASRLGRRRSGRRTAPGTAAGAGWRSGRCSNRNVPRGPVTSSPLADAAHGAARGPAVRVVDVAAAEQAPARGRTRSPPAIRIRPSASIVDVGAVRCRVRAVAEVEDARLAAGERRLGRSPRRRVPSVQREHATARRGRERRIGLARGRPSAASTPAGDELGAAVGASRASHSDRRTQARPRSARRRCRAAGSSDLLDGVRAARARCGRRRPSRRAAAGSTDVAPHGVEQVQDVRRAAGVDDDARALVPTPRSIGVTRGMAGAAATTVDGESEQQDRIASRLMFERAAS